MAKRLFDYLLYRKGSNSANQPMSFDWEPIAIVRAASRDEAESLTWGDEGPSVHGSPSLVSEVVASCGNLTVYANQSLKAVPSSKAKASDWNYVLEQDAMAEAYGY